MPVAGPGLTDADRTLDYLPELQALADAARDWLIAGNVRGAYEFGQWIEWRKP